MIVNSDPTTATLVGLFAELGKHPAVIDKLYLEVANIDVNDEKQLRTLPYLNGVICEALRLYPSLPSGGFRKTSKHGITVGGRYIPPYTTIIAPRYSINRRKRFSFLIITCSSTFEVFSLTILGHRRRLLSKAS